MFGVSGNMVNNVEESKVNRDKSALAELRQATIVALSDEKYINAEASEYSAKLSSEGELKIADLFDAENNHGIAEKISSIIGADYILLKSDMSIDCIVTIYMDGNSGKVVLQVDSEKYTYYIDEKGEHEGTYSR